MTRFRLILLAVLTLLPFAVLMGLGSYHLWHTGMMWVWWPLLGVFGLAYYLGWRWTRRRGALLPLPPPPPEYWVDRDKIAWAKVEARAKQYETVTLEQISRAEHYSALSLELAKEVGAVYNPDSPDPFDSLTLPEVLACVELAAADLDAMVRKYVPGVHLLRIRDVKRAHKAYGWYRTGQDVYWAGAAVFDPVSTGLRYLASRGGLGTLAGRIQGNLIVWFHSAFVHQLGRYLIELNSGRLKVGAKRYREILAQHQEPPANGNTSASPAAGSQPSTEPTANTTATTTGATKPITFAVLGAVKAGKSSLVNSLLGKQSATVDRLPVAAGIRYDLTLPGSQPVILFDTSGYGEHVNDRDFSAAIEASRDADLILLVTPALNPGRTNDIDLLDRLQRWFASKPHLRMPPVVVVVNQIDLVSPKAEWNPPYEWKAGSRPKEVNIREAIAAVMEQIGPWAAAVVPVCAREGETFGIVEGLVPAVAAHLDHARGSAILKAFDIESADRQVGKVFDQIGNVVSAGMEALGGWLKKKP